MYHPQKLLIKTAQVKGSDLKIGDILRVWWNDPEEMEIECGDRIKELSPMKTFLNCFAEGVQLASFEYLHSGMTIDNAGYYTIFLEG